MLFPDSQKESDDAAWIRGGDEWAPLHNLTSLPRFQFEFEAFFFSFFTGEQNMCMSLQMARKHILHILSKCCTSTHCK